MRRLTIGLIAILILFVRSVEAETPYFGWGSGYPSLFRTTWREVVDAFARQVAKCLEEKSVFSPQIDGGGDGGGDGSGGGGGAGDSGGDAGGGSGDGDGNGDASTGDTGAVGDPGDPGNDDAQAPADPDAVSNATDPSDVADVPTDDPALGLHGGPDPGVAENAPAVSLAARFGPSIPGAAVNVGINAIIVSGARTPWEAIGKTPGVKNVAVIGGIIALGETPFARPSATIEVGAADSPPAWLKLKPDMRYLNGSLFPPVVPDLIDIRTMSYTEEAVENPSK